MTYHHHNSESLHRLDAFFAMGGSNGRNRLSARFIDKYQHRFAKDRKAFSRWIDYRLEKFSKILDCDNFAGMRILDAGAGFGLHSIMFALAGAEQVVAVDILPGRISDLTNLTEIAGLEGRLLPVCNDYMKVIPDYGPYDLIIGTCFLSHINDHDSFFQACSNHLKPGGKLYVMDDNNTLSPLRQISVRREWWAAEFKGDQKRGKGHFLRQRREIANNCLPPLPRVIHIPLREWCVWATRGMTKPDVRAYCRWVSDTDKTNPRPPKPPCAYRDPRNGVPEERLLNPLTLRRKLLSHGFKVTVFPTTASTERFRFMQILIRIANAVKRSFELVAVREK